MPESIKELKIKIEKEYKNLSEKMKLKYKEIIKNSNVDFLLEMIDELEREEELERRREIIENKRIKDREISFDLIDDNSSNWEISSESDPISVFLESLISILGNADF